VMTRTYKNGFESAPNWHGFAILINFAPRPRKKTSKSATMHVVYVQPASRSELPARRI
jgi:hypothetical protein